MMERDDFIVLHEPFSYLYYGHQKQASVPYMHEVANPPGDYEDVKSHILSSADRTAVFFKDMCYHCHDFLVKDEDFLGKLVHTFIIRDPGKSIASHHAINPEVTQEEIGYERECGIFRKVAELTGEIPPVVDADDLKNDPEGIVATYCDALGIPYIPESLRWEKGHKKEWDMWQEWHIDAAQSIEIHGSAKKYAVTVDNDARLKSYCDFHLPFYEEMYRHRLVPKAVRGAPINRGGAMPRQ